MLFGGKPLPCTYPKEKPGYKLKKSILWTQKRSGIKDQLRACLLEFASVSAPLKRGMWPLNFSVQFSFSRRFCLCDFPKGSSQDCCSSNVVTVFAFIYFYFFRLFRTGTRNAKIRLLMVNLGALSFESSTVISTDAEALNTLAAPWLGTKSLAVTWSKYHFNQRWPSVNLVARKAFHVEMSTSKSSKKFQTGFSVNALFMRGGTNCPEGDLNPCQSHSLPGRFRVPTQ